MKRKNILLINLVSSPGSGKTALLEATAQRLKEKLKMAVLVGDLETERDADRIKKQGIYALQIVTGGICHLEAQMIHQVLDQIPMEDLDILFIENVGNLVCPSSFDLGEDIRVTLIAVTEGDDKPKKYPKMFLTSDMMMVTKVDLLPYVPFSLDAVSQDAREVNHEIEIMTASSLKGEGIDDWCEYLLQKVKEKKAQAEAVAG
jgi:hydrogenase nickel incorporation protein HypB